MHLFVYGTLMFPEIWERVTGREFDARPAVVEGFAAHRVRNGVYPVMVRSAAESRLAGLVHLAVDEATLARVDGYESELYDRVTIAATLDTGEVVHCQAYVLPTERSHESSGEPWDASTFEREHMAAYLTRLV